MNQKSNNNMPTALWWLNLTGSSGAWRQWQRHRCLLPLFFFFFSIYCIYFYYFIIFVFFLYPCKCPSKTTAQSEASIEVEIYLYKECRLDRCMLMRICPQGLDGFDMFIRVMDGHLAMCGVGLFCITETNSRLSTCICVNEYCIFEINDGGPAKVWLNVFEN